LQGEDPWRHRFSGIITCIMSKKYPYQNLSLKNMKGEVWKDIPGFEDEYQLSNYGRLKSQDRWVNYKRCDCFRPGRIKKLRVIFNSKNGNRADLHMQLHKDGMRYRFSVARQVYNLFVSAFDMEDHSVVITRKDGDLLNCYYKNLILKSLSNIVKEGFALNKRKSIFQLQIRPVTQYDENGCKIATYPSAKKASLATDIHPEYINGAANYKKRMAGGFYWRYGKVKQQIDITPFSKPRDLPAEDAPANNYQNRSLKNLPGEKWMPVKNYEGFYEISDTGRVKSLRRLKEIVTPKGNLTRFWTREFVMKQPLQKAYNRTINETLNYLTIALKKDGVSTTYLVSRLVYETFGQHENQVTDKKIIHIDGNGLNNNISNLKPASVSEIIKSSFQKKRRISLFTGLTSAQRKKFALKTTESNKIPVSQYDLDGNYIASFDSATAAANAVGLADTTISNAVNGRLCTAGGFVWRKGNAKTVDMKSFWESKRKQFLEKRGQKVTQYDLNGKKIASYLAIAEAVRATGARSGEICKVLNGKQKIAGGFIWKKGEGGPVIDVSNFVYGHAWRGLQQQKKVNQYTVEGKYIRTFDSLKAAAKFVAVHPAAVSVALRESYRTCKGFKWRFAE
jgi:hypothetical protein